MKQTVLTFLLMWAVVLQGRAQGEFRTWCYNGGSSVGRSIKIRFGPRPGLPDSCLFRNFLGLRTRGISPLGGAASLSDAQGRLLGYSGGYSLMNRNSRLMPHGVLLDPDSASNWFLDASHQPVALAPAPANASTYYAFYWRRPADDVGRKTYALTYALVDSRLDGGLGDVVSKGRVLGRTSIPSMTVVRHANNRDYWVLTCTLDGRGFQAYLLSQRGIVPAPVVSTVRQTVPSGASELKAAPNGRRLALATDTQLAGGRQYAVCVYDFDNATGAVTNELAVHRGTEGAFSISFSPNSQILYTAELAEGRPPPQLPVRRLRELWQYNLSLPSEAAVQASRYWVSRGALTPPLLLDYVNCLGLQLAPDSTLWTAGFYIRSPLDPVTQAPRTTFAAVVRYPDVVGAGCGFEPEGYAYLPGQTTGFFLPNLITNMLYAPAALNHAAGCPEDSVQFWASSAGDPAGLRWDFGEPAAGAANAARGRQAAHRYAQGGTYAVRLTLADGRVLTQAVTVAAQAADFTNANVFTPNADGLNDAFVPVRAPLPGGRLRVFGRWGQAVFATADPALRWDGAGAPGGEYFYDLDYPDCQGTTRRRRGTVTLVR